MKYVLLEAGRTFSTKQRVAKTQSYKSLGEGVEAFSILGVRLFLVNKTSEPKRLVVCPCGAVTLLSETHVCLESLLEICEAVGDSK